MTVDSIKAKMLQLYDEYTKQSRSQTSVQRPTFDRQFEKKHGVRIINGRITLEKPVILDEICSVQDVSISNAYIDSFFWGSRTVECYGVSCDNDFSFFARFGSGAERLNRGQKIHITGKVAAKVENHGFGDGGISARIIAQPFQIKFSVV